MTRLFRRVLVRDLEWYVAAGWRWDGGLEWVWSCSTFEAIVERDA